MFIFGILFAIAVVAVSIWSLAEALTREVADTTDESIELFYARREGRL